MSTRYEVPVISKSALASGVTEVTFDISKTNFHFKAGQYATITLPATTDQPTTSQFHDFSIASSPNDHERLKIAFRNSDSFFKRTLLGLSLGAPVIFEGPSGNFTLPDQTDKHIVCVAGGIGITPFMSMFTFFDYKRLADVSKDSLFFALPERIGYMANQTTDSLVCIEKAKFHNFLLNLVDYSEPK